MNFITPMAFAFAATIPVVILFYLLKRKRVVQLVSSTLLWQKFLAETQASAPFQRLRHNWLLILQILLLLLAVLALARPYFAGKSSGGRIVVGILDASASMQSTDETPSRFEKARKDALALVDSLHENDQMVVLLAAGNTEVRQSPTSDKSALKRAITSAQPADSPTRLKEALKLAETLIQNNKQAEVHLFSDGAVSGLEEFENKGLPLVYHRTGQRGINLGIVNLDVRTNPENPAQRAIFTTIQNSSTNAQETNVELLLGDKIVDVKSISLKPKESVPQVFLASQEQDGVFSVRLTAQDDLAADNKASVVSLLPQPVKVLLVSAGNRYLEKALRAIPTVLLTKETQLTGAADEFDLVVLDNVTPVVWPAKNVLAINTQNTNWFTAITPVDAPVIVDWKASHPLLRFVNFDNVAVAESSGVTLPPWGMSIVDSQVTPLVIAGEISSQRVIWIGFDTLQSLWPLRISFPIFIANAVEWLNPAAELARQLTIPAGDPFRIALSEAVKSAEITLPDGTTRTREIDQARKELLFGETSRQGVYKVKAGTNQFTFAVNLLDTAETDNHPREEIQFGAYAKVAASTERQANLEIWRWFALTALLVLMFEWWYYHRRTV